MMHGFKKGHKTHNRKNLLGRRFGRLLVMEDAKRSMRGMAVWVCRCDCGKIKEVAAYEMTSGHSKSCGCLKREAAVRSGRQRAKPLAIGSVFGKLRVLRRTGKPTHHKFQHKYLYYECVCDCGNITVVTGSNLRTGRSNACNPGCGKRIFPDEDYNLSECKRNAKHLSDEYIRHLLSDKKGLHIKRKRIAHEMVEAKREQLLLYREIKQLKQELKNGTY